MRTLLVVVGELVPVLCLDCKHAGSLFAHDVQALTSPKQMSGRDTFQTEKGRNTSTILKMIHRAQIYMMTTIKNQTFRRRPCICFFFLTPSFWTLPGDHGLSLSLLPPLSSSSSLRPPAVQIALLEKQAAAPALRTCSPGCSLLPRYDPILLQSPAVGCVLISEAAIRTT